MASAVERRVLPETPPQWPLDMRADLDAFYGKHVLRDGRPSPGWESATLSLVAIPYPMELAWNRSVTVKRIRCHRLVALSLLGVLDRLMELYPTQEERLETGVAILGGVYEFRRVGGSDRLSCHSWGAAIDLDPARNPLGVAHHPRVGLPLAAIKAFQDAGWTWGGDWRRPDPQHFQAART